MPLCAFIIFALEPTATAPARIPFSSAYRASYLSSVSFYSTDAAFLISPRL